MAYEGHRRKNVIYYFEKIRNVEITIVVSRQTAMATVGRREKAREERGRESKQTDMHRHH